MDGVIGGISVVGVAYGGAKGTTNYFRPHAARDIDILSTIQRGGVQTPAVGHLKSRSLWWENRSLIGQLKRGDVLLDSVGVARTKAAVFGKIGDLTAATGKEIALLRTKQGLVLRLGKKSSVPASGAKCVIAHHPSGRLALSGRDFAEVFVHPARQQKSTILIGPSGAWRRYSSNQTILGGSF